MSTVPQHFNEPLMQRPKFVQIAVAATVDRNGAVVVCYALDSIGHVWWKKGDAPWECTTEGLSHDYTPPAQT